MSIPKPTLGEISAITIATPDLDNSLKFYQQLGFNEILQSDFPFPFIQISDGALMIMLRKDTNPYFALSYYAKDIDRSIAHIESTGLSFAEKPKPGDFVRRHILKSPDGMNISIVFVPEGFSQPPGPTMLNTPPSDLFNPDKYANKICGMFGELAEAVKDIETSISFYSKLGFQVMHKTNAPYPWAILSDGLAIVGLHQATNFSKPRITFFAADSKEKIDKLKQGGLKNYQDQGPANITITTPEQQEINLFKLGM